MRQTTSTLLVALGIITLLSCAKPTERWIVAIKDDSGKPVGTLEIIVRSNLEESSRELSGHIVAVSGLDAYPIGAEAEIEITNGRFFVDLNAGTHDNNTYLDGRISDGEASGAVTVARGPMGRISGSFTASFSGD